MSNREEKIKEIIELIRIWFFLKDMVWTNAKSVLEERINELCKELGIE